MINWPAFIKHDGEDELIYISSATAWQNDEEMLLYVFTERDVLIDSHGQVFSLTDIQTSFESAIALATATVDNINELVRAHAVVCGECCVEKIYCQTLPQAMEFIESLSD
ncbi:DUF4144 family protein [Colwelliaceae bacterium BS250]